MLDDNPYKPTLVDETKATLVDEPKSSLSRFVVTLWWFAYLHPAIALALIHICWTITTVSLGRPPKFGEHPENEVAHSVLHLLDLPAVLLSLAMPILIPIALLWGFVQPFAQRIEKQMTKKHIVCVVGHLLILAIVFAAYRYDPMGVLNWFWD